MISLMYLCSRSFDPDDADDAYGQRSYSWSVRLGVPTTEVVGHFDISEAPTHLHWVFSAIDPILNFDSSSMFVNYLP